MIRIKTNVNRGPTFRFVNAMEYITVGYYDEIKKQRIKEHSNEVGCSNLLVYPAVTRKLRHVTTTERGLVNPYQKPQRLMMRLVEMFSNEEDWIMDLFSGTGICSIIFLNVLKVLFRFRPMKILIISYFWCLGTTSACALKLFRNVVALEKDEEQVNFINMRLRALWECPDQDEEVGAKHIADTERFQPASREPIPPLAGEPGELVELDDDLMEDPTVASLSGVDTTALNVDDSSPIDDESNDMDNLLVM